MGQDREFSQEQKRFALKAVFKFRKYWEEFEEAQLIADRDALLKLREEDEEIFTEEYQQTKDEKAAQMVENHLNPPKPEEGSQEGEDWVDPETEAQDPFTKETGVAAVKLKYLVDQLKEDDVYQVRYRDLVPRKVVQLHGLFKAIFYFLGYDKEQVCVEGSQLFVWKKARKLWDKELIERMSNYVFSGPKEKNISMYQKINFVEKLLHSTSQDEINSYNHSLGLIYKWMRMAIETRKRDIVHRLSITKTKREERAAREEEAKARAEERAAALAEAHEKFEGENKEDIDKYNEYQAAIEAGEPPQLEDGEEAPTKPIFDENFFFFNWDEEHPEVEIPAEVTDDKDHDWVITQEKKDDLVEQYIQEQNEAAVEPEKAKPPGKK